MSIRRSARPYSFTTIDNQVFSSGLSYRAMGLLTFLLSKPDHWEVSVAHLVNTVKGSAAPSGRDAIYSTLAELREKGFVVRMRNRTNTGKLGKVDYVVYDKPQAESDLNLEKPLTDKPDVVAPLTAKPDTAEPDTAEPTQVNTDLKVNTDFTSSTGLGEPFAMTFDWQPSDHFAQRMAMAGIPADVLTPDLMVEFRSYWTTRPERNTQSRWDHKLLQAVQRARRMPNGQGPQPGGPGSKRDEVRKAVSDHKDTSWAEGLS